MLCSLDNGDYINILAIVINSILAIWIVRNLQKNLTNKRFLKDHLIQEIKDLRIEYKNFLNDLNSGYIKPKKVAPWFKLMNIKVQDTMEIVSDKYKIEKSYLSNYQIELRDLVTELDEFNSNYKENKQLKLESQSLRELIKFQQENNSKFNEIIIKINDK